MTTRYSRGNIRFVCNECGDESDEYPSGDFHEAWDTLKEEGWRAWKDDFNDKWNHRCPECY